MPNTYLASPRGKTLLTPAAWAILKCPQNRPPLHDAPSRPHDPCRQSDLIQSHRPKTQRCARLAGTLSKYLLVAVTKLPSVILYSQHVPTCPLLGCQVGGYFFFRTSSERWPGNMAGALASQLHWERPFTSRGRENAWRLGPTFPTYKRK